MNQDLFSSKPNDNWPKSLLSRFKEQNNEDTLEINWDFEIIKPKKKRNKQQEPLKHTVLIDKEKQQLSDLRNERKTYKQMMKETSEKELYIKQHSLILQQKFPKLKQIEINDILCDAFTRDQQKGEECKEKMYSKLDDINKKIKELEDKNNALEKSPQIDIKFMTPYRMYRKDVVGDVKEHHQEMTGQERQVYIKDQWKRLDRKEKFFYVLKSRAEKERVIFEKKKQFYEAMIEEQTQFTEQEPFQLSSASSIITQEDSIDDIEFIFNH